jgi:putative glycosyl hydrolase-like family 6 (GHL6) protein
MERLKMRHKLPNALKTDRRTFLKLATTSGAVLLSGLPSVAAESTYPELDQMWPTHDKTGLVSPQKTYRMMEWECHTPPEANFNINVEGAVKAADDAGAESLMFYTQDHWGYALYPSESALRHPNLDYDLFGTEVSLASKYGISTVAYYSLQFNNQCVIGHPDWGWVNEEGAHQKDRWYITCLDTPYRQYVLKMMEEIFSGYRVQELFLDIFGIQFELYHQLGRNPFCFCKYTEDAWNREYPADPYREGFKTREGWERRYQWHHRRTMTEMLDEIIKVARKHRPDILISLNGGPESFPNNIMQKVDFIYAEPLPCPTGVALGSIVMRGWGRPYFQAGLFTEYGYVDAYPGSIPRVQADALIVQNARTFFVGDAPVLGGLDQQGFSKRWFEVAKVTWEDVKNVDRFLGPDIEPLLSTAMLYSESTRAELDAENRPMDFRHSTLGALETLTYAGRPVESLPEFNLKPEMLDRFEALVLPEVKVLSDPQAEVIRRWVDKGGTLIASYQCGLLDSNRKPRNNFPLADVFGVDYVSENDKYSKDAEGKQRSENFTSTYLESNGHSLASMLSVSTVGLPGPFLRVRRTTAEEVMRYRLPFMVQDLSRNQWFNWGPPPPGAQTAGTAVAYNKFRRGQSLYLGVPIFWAMQWRPYWIRNWIPALIRHLVPNPIAELSTDPASEYLHGSFFYDRRKHRILVQLLNTIELATNGEMRPAPRVDIRVDRNKLKLVGARVVWPREKDLTVQQDDRYARIAVQDLERYTALYLKLG